MSERDPRKVETEPGIEAVMPEEKTTTGEHIKVQKPHNLTKLLEQFETGEKKIEASHVEEKPLSPRMQDLVLQEAPLSVFRADYAQNERIGEPQPFQLQNKKTTEFKLITAEGEPSRTPILFIEGMAHTCNFWKTTAAALNNVGHPIVMADLHKQENADVRDFRVNDYVELYKQIIEKLGQKVHIVCHSQGTAIGARLAQDYPALVNRLTLMSPLPPYGAIGGTLKYGLKHPLKLFISSIGGLFGKNGTNAFFNKDKIVQEFFVSNQLSPEEVREYIEENIGDDSFKLYLYDLLFGQQWMPFGPKSLPRNEEITVPTQVVFGNNDALLSPSAMQKTAEKYGGEITMVKGAAHDCGMYDKDKWRIMPRVINRFAAQQMLS